MIILSDPTVCSSVRLLLPTSSFISSYCFSVTTRRRTFPFSGTKLCTRFSSLRETLACRTGPDIDRILYHIKPFQNQFFSKLSVILSFLCRPLQANQTWQSHSHNIIFHPLLLNITLHLEKSFQRFFLPAELHRMIHILPVHFPDTFFSFYIRSYDLLY